MLVLGNLRLFLHITNVSEKNQQVGRCGREKILSRKIYRVYDCAWRIVFSTYAMLEELVIRFQNHLAGTLLITRLLMHNSPNALTWVDLFPPTEHLKM